MNGPSPSDASPLPDGSLPVKLLERWLGTAKLSSAFGLAPPEMAAEGMVIVGSYPAYELANEDQLRLEMIGVGAQIKYVPTGADQAYFGMPPVYALIVRVADLGRAKEALMVVADEAHVSLLACPHCRSADVIEIDDESVSLTALLALTVGLFAPMKYWKREQTYRCQACGKKYQRGP